MVTCVFTQAWARATAAKPPSTTNTRSRPGNQRRVCFTICRTQATLVLWRRWWRDLGGQHSTVKNGNAHTRVAHGTGTSSIRDTHFSPKHVTTCLRDERTASR